MRVLIAVLVCAVVLLARVTWGQCGPQVVNEWGAGPIVPGTQLYQGRRAMDLCVFDDGSGPALFAVGDFVLMPVPSFSPQLCVIKYQDGRWHRFGNDVPWPYPVNASSLAVADFSGVGGPGLSLYVQTIDGMLRWNGGGWTRVTTSVSSSVTRLLAHADAQGPVLLAYGAMGVRAWRGSGGWTAYGSGLPAGNVTSLRVIDDGTGASLYAAGPVIGGQGAILKLAGGTWTQVSAPAVGSAAINDVALADDGSGPAMYAATSTGLWVRRSEVWERLPEVMWANQLFVVPGGAGTEVWVSAGINIAANHVVAGLAKRVNGAWDRPVDFYRDQVPAAPVAVAPIPGEPGSLAVAGYFDNMCVGGHHPQLSYPRDKVQSAYTLCKITPGSVRSFGGGIGGGRPGSGPGTYTDHLTSGPFLSTVELDDGPRLVVTGTFMSVGGQFARYAAMYDGEEWTPMSAAPFLSFVETRPASGAFINGARRVVTWFNHTGMQYWDGAAWVPFACPRSNLIEAGQDLYAYTPGQSGLYRRIADSWVEAVTGTITTATVARLNGLPPRMYIVRSGAVYELDGDELAIVPATPIGVRALTGHEDSAGRQYLFATTPTHVHVFDGQTWTMEQLSLANTYLVPVVSMRDGLGPAVYMAGNFARVGNVIARGVAVWRDGVWTPVSVAPYTDGEPIPFTPVMAALGDRVYIAGNFFQFNRQEAERLVAIQGCPRICTDDYDGDGDGGTQADIAAFFACIGGRCCERCTADFNNDGDTATDQDIESFFRVLGGGAC